MKYAKNRAGCRELAEKPQLNYLLSSKSYQVGNLIQSGNHSRCLIIMLQDTMTRGAQKKLKVAVQIEIRR